MGELVGGLQDGAGVGGVLAGCSHVDPHCAHMLTFTPPPSPPCSEHGETLSKLEKKAALTLQMNFQVGGGPQAVGRVPAVCAGWALAVQQMALGARRWCCR